MTDKESDPSLERKTEKSELAAWYRIKLTRRELQGGELDILKGAFHACYIAHNGPLGMAMLAIFNSDPEEDFDTACTVYFTPPAIPHVRALIKAYSGVLSEPPPRRNLNIIYGDPDMVYRSFREF